MAKNIDKIVCTFTSDSRKHPESNFTRVLNYIGENLYKIEVLTLRAGLVSAIFLAGWCFRGVYDDHVEREGYSA